MKKPESVKSGMRKAESVKPGMRKAVIRKTRNEKSCKLPNL
jgi:hypothetical protein